MTGHSRLDDLRIELASIQEQLISLGDESFDEKARLHARQEELRGQVREILASQHDDLSVEQLKREIEHLDRRIDELRGLHLDHAAAAQTGKGGGIDPANVHEFNRQVDQASGLGALQEQRRKLKDRLAVLEGSG